MRGSRLWAYRAALCTGLSTGIAGIASPGEAWALAFPTDNDWVVLSRSSAPICDAAGDSSAPAVDVVGNADFPMAYVQGDATHLYFRLRVDKSVLQTATNLKPYGWGCVIDTNFDASNFEYSAMLDGVSSQDTVSVWQNVVQEAPNDPGDTLGNMPVHAYLGPFQAGQPGFGYARERDAGNVFGSPNVDADFFADWAIERSKLAPAVGPLTPLRFACGSASDGKNLNQDFAGTAYLPDLFSDPVLCDDSGCHAQTCAEFGTACSVGKGKCAGAGVFVCLAHGAECNAEAEEGKSSSEVCNGMDDDCDGDTDEGFDIGAPCSVGLGACAAAGHIVCADNGGTACTVVAAEASTELCGNGIDDDCDGETDEGFDIGAPCSVGVGACAAMGQIECAVDGSAACNAVALAPTAEVCGNPVDDDCDGALDNGCPEAPVDVDVDTLPECAMDTDCDAGKVCVERACADGCRGDGSVTCLAGQYCDTRGGDAGQCVPIPKHDIYLVTGGCYCQTGASRDAAGGLAWAAVLAGAMALRRRKR